MAENPEDLIVTDAELRRQLPALAKELKIGGGSGIEQVADTVTLDGSGQRVREFYTVASGVTIGGEAFPEDTALVARRLASGAWERWVIGTDAGWRPFAKGSTPPGPVTDTVPPISGTLAVSDVKATGFTLTVSGASDAGGLSSQPYSFSLDGGKTWTAWQATPVYTATGLAQDTAYAVQHRVRDTAGNITIGTATQTRTVVDLASWYLAHDFAGEAGTQVVGTKTKTGGHTFEAITGTGALLVAQNGSLVLTGAGSAAGSASAPSGVSVGAARLAFLPTHKLDASITVNGLQDKANGGGSIRFGIAVNGGNVIQIAYFASENAFKVFAPAQTQVKAQAWAETGPATLRVTYDGATYTAYLNGAVLATGAITVATTSAPEVYLGSTHQNVKLSNLSVRAMGV